MIRFAPRTRSIAEVRALIRAAPRVRLAAFVVATGLLSAVALLFSPPAVVSYGQAGVVADREVRAPRSTAFTSESLTQAERDKAAAAVQRVYVADPAVNVTASSHLQAALTGIARIRNDATQARDQRIAALTKLSEVALSVPLATDALDMTAAEFDQLSKELDPALRTIYQQGIRPEQLDAQRADTTKALPPAWTDRQKRIGAELLKQSVQANLSFDANATAAAQQTARDGAPIGVGLVADIDHPDLACLINV